MDECEMIFKKKIPTCLNDHDDIDSVVADEAYEDYVKGGKKSHTAKEIDRKYGIGHDEN